MNQEKIGRIIKDIREKNKLKQEDLAKKYNVSIQAVSKWERGLSTPDIETLSKICKDYNISMDNIINNKKNNKAYLIITGVIVIALITTMVIFFTRKDSFEFKQISTTCSDFEISGNIAYDKNSSHLHLSNVTYCGKDDNSDYIEIECKLYEKDGKIKKELANCDYKGTDKIQLEEFLKSVNLHIKDFSEKCSLYNDQSLYLEINATDTNNKTTNYKIPLIISDECK